MKKIQVSTATNNQLDWLVAKAEGKETFLIAPQFFQGGKLVFKGEYNWVGDAHVEANYTTDPAQMWPIIEREKIDIEHTNWEPPLTYAKMLGDEAGSSRQNGASSLIAAARCYVVSKLGETVEVPEELT